MPVINRESTIHRILCVVLIEAIFSCLNPKPNDGLLPSSMPEVCFKQTGHGLTDIMTD